MKNFRQAETGVTAAQHSATPVHHQVLLNTALWRTQSCSLLLALHHQRKPDQSHCPKPLRQGPFCLVLASRGQILYRGVSVQLSPAPHKCSVDLVAAVFNRLKTWRSKPKARSILQASWAWLILWHRWTVCDVQLNFERCFIFLILWGVL